MRVVTDAGTVHLGVTETAPTIGITDYSRRETDAFGVTTVVPRGFSRTLAAKLMVPSENVDGLQQQLAALRATSAQWIVGEGIAWLSVHGFYKSFDIDLAVPPVSYCSITIEGLAETETAGDPGGDPAPDGQVSTLQLVQPIAITDAVLVGSNVAEADADAWNASISYAVGARVIRTSTHRVYQSLSVHNAGNAPETSPAVWLDLGPTNRWAMFDQALGTATSAGGSIAVTLAASAATAVVLLDVGAATVRVQANAYDRTLPADAGAITFLDLPANAGQIAVTIAGSGQVSVGTLLIGVPVALGITEASPSAGITDYSRKDVDEFGAVTIVQRAWAKRMAAKALIRTDAIDAVAGRIAAVRARPSLWLGQAGIDSITVYGFWKDFSIEVGETLSKLSLTIEGLSTAPKIQPLLVNWSDVVDDDGNRPAAGATRNVPRGEWSAMDTYAQGDVVTYQGSSYIAGENVPFGTLPTNAAYWDLLASVGPTGSTGAPGANGANGATGSTGSPGANGANGANGAAGPQGVAGPPGSNGQPAYVHVAYANSADGSQDFITGTANAGRVYIGLYTDATASSSTDYHAYSWSRLTGQNGTNGTNGTPGPVGADGRPSYVHFAYADSLNGQVNFTTGDAGARTYIGVYSDFTVPDSNDPSAYTWSLIKGADGATGATGSPGAAGATGPAGSPGIAGAPGTNGQPSYVHVAYSNNSDGSQDFVTGQANPGRTYIGIYTDASSGGSGDYRAYNWSRLTGQAGANGTNGTNGTPGPVGPDGRQSYVHFAYANSANGSTDFTTGASGGRIYIGVYSDYTAADSGSPGSYTWSLIKGADGGTGATGAPGGDGFSMTLASDTIFVQCDYTGAVKSGELPRYVPALIYRGTANITGSCTTRITGDGGNGLAADSSGTTTRVYGFGSDSWLSITASYAGVDICTRRLTIKAVRDNAPPSSTTAASGSLDISVTSFSYDGSGVSQSNLIITTSSSGVLKYNGGGLYRAPVSQSATTQVAIAGKAQYRPVGGGGWSDMGSEVAGSEASYIPNDGPDPGSISVTQSVSGLSANANYEIRFVARLTEANNGAAGTQISGGNQRVTQG